MGGLNNPIGWRSQGSETTGVAVAVSNYKVRLSLPCTRVLSDPTDRRPSFHTQQPNNKRPESRWQVGPCV